MGSMNTGAKLRRRSAWVALAVGMLAINACEEDTVGEGERCERAQDCDSGLVCARIQEDEARSVCAKLQDTREADCQPEFSGMQCDLVLIDGGDAGM